MIIDTLAAVVAQTNPLDGVSPDPGLLGGQFSSWWAKIMGGAWGISIVIAAFFLMKGIVSMGAAKKSHHPGDFRESKKEAVVAGAALGGLAGLGVIVGAILFIASP